MEVELRVEPEFLKQAKRLSKKYLSLEKDLQDFRKSLVSAPYQGSSLGEGVRKEQTYNPHAEHTLNKPPAYNV